MKNKIFIFSILIAMLACDKKSQSERDNSDAIEQPVSDANRECFWFVTEKDTITMAMIRKVNNVTGDLVYDWNERDGNVGTFVGLFEGDTLRIDYTFQSEGLMSVRQEVYVRKGNTLVQGSGEIEVKGDRQYFKNPKTLEFGNSVILTKTDCWVP